MKTRQRAPLAWFDIRQPALIGWLLVPILWLSAAQVLAGARAALDRSSVYQGDSVTLTIETDGVVQDRAPDLAVLKKDFKVLGSSNSTRIQIVNGRTSKTTGWVVQLQPKHLGRIRIPPIQVGNQRTQPLVLTVGEIPPEVARQMAQQLFVETEVTPTDRAAYVQQQVLLTVRLYYDLQLLDGDLADPQPEGDAVLERLGRDRSYRATRNGRRYRVIERRYALFPEKSGELRIPAVEFQGRAASQRRSRRPGSGMNDLMQRFFRDRGIQDPFAGDPFFGRSLFDDDFFANTPFGDSGTPVSARGKPLTLKVRPRPPGYTGKEWLPAQQLTLHDSWAETPPELHVGEPATRTIAIEARGLEASQLPRIQLPASPAMKIYPEQPVNENRVEGDAAIGRSQQTMAIVPTAEGRLIVPEVRLTWWDTAANRQREAVLPHWEFNVLPGTATRPRQPLPSSRPVPTASPMPATAPERARARVAASVWERLAPLWPWLTGLLVLILVVLVVTFRRGGRQPTRPRSQPPVAGTPGQPATAVVPAATEADRSLLLRRLRDACEHKDPRASARALLDLARAQWPADPPLDLGALAKRVPSGAEQIRMLDRVLYASTEQPWDGAALWACFGGGFKPGPVPSGAAEEALAPLYPPRASDMS